MKKYKVIYERANCIGAAPCVFANPTDWVMADDGKATLKNGQAKGANFERIIDETELVAMMSSAEVCPVNVIHIEDMETGKRLI